MSALLFDRVHYFIVMYESASMKAAAEHVSISPQGISKAIKNLESDLGVTLFNFSPSGGKVPSVYADALYKTVKKIELQERQLSASIKTLKEGYSTVRVGSPIGSSTIFGQIEAEEFMAVHPDAHIEVSEQPDAVCEDRVKDGLLDIAFVPLPVSERLHAEPIYSSQIMLWVNSNDPLSEKGCIAPEDLSGKTIFAPPPSFNGHIAILEKIEAAADKPIKVVSCPQIIWNYQYVLQGSGVGIVPSYIARLRAFNLDESVRAIPIRDCSWDVVAIWEHSHELTLLERMIIDFAKERATSIGTRAVDL